MHHLSHGKLRSFFLNRLRTLVILMSMLILVISSFFVGNAVTHAASYCQVTYAVTNQWSGGFEQVSPSRTPVARHGRTGS